MLTEYIQKALEKAHYEIIKDALPYYGEVPGLDGVWASGATLEECRRELAQVIENWILLGIAKGHPVPPLDGLSIELPELARY
jgi:predicted RNase H-like HicB family nuclease